jgi:hypothetical protein
LELKENA